jgi:hypothetical protein
MKAYRIRDLQFECRYFADGSLFETKEKILEQLASYHDIDFSGVKNDDTPYTDIWEWLETNYKTDEEKLNAILNYGQWELEEVEDYEKVRSIIHNFIIYYTSNDKEREDLEKVLNDYLEIGEPFC